ncbi:MAG: 50S ribosomal protein L15e [Candidatus Micrarchaeaceae archaeon]
MGLYQHIDKTFQEEYKERGEALKGRLIQWRKEPVVNRVAKPTNIARARKLGYKAKDGVIVVRVRVERGLRKRRKMRGGRKPSKSGRFFAYRKSLQSMAEERATRKFSNCEVVNSYYVGEDGSYKFFEAILIDRSHPAIASDAYYSDILRNRGRVYRGLTSSGVKHRGMRMKGFGTIRNRPSVRASQRGILRV